MTILDSEPKRRGAYELNSQQMGIVLRYTLLMTAASVVAGIIIGFILIAFVGTGSQHTWGVFDSDLVSRCIGALVVAYGVYWRLLQRHPQQFFQNGLAIAFLNGAVNLLIQAIQYPEHLSAKNVGVGFAAEFLIFLVVSALIWPRPEKKDGNSA